MSLWRQALAALCVVGFLKEVDILAPFQDFYLESDPRYNLTAEQVEFQVHPVFSYSYICVIPVVVVVTDLVYYKPIISLGILALIAKTALITWGRGLLAAQLANFTYALSITTNIAYFSYAFAVVEPEKYRLAAGFSRAALLVGTLFGYTVGQVLVHIFHTDYFVLNCVTLGVMCVAIVVSVFIPSAVLSSFQQVIERELQSPDRGRFAAQISVQGSGSIQNTHIQGEATLKRGDNSIPRMGDAQGASQDANTLPHATGPMFYDIDTSSLGFSYNDMMSECSDMSSLDRTRLDDYQQVDVKDAENIKEKFMLSINSVKETFSNKSVIVWSIFWIILTFVDFQVGRTIHPFLDKRYPERDSFELDGAVESVSIFVGAILVLVVGFVKVNLTNTFFLMGGCSTVLCLLLFLVALLAPNMWMNICMYACCRVMYQVIITIAMYQVATHVSGRRFAFVFGVNMLTSGVLEVVFSGARAGDQDTGFTLTAQFCVYAGILGILGLSLIILSVYCVIVRRRNGSDSPVRDDLDTLVQD